MKKTTPNLDIANFSVDVHAFHLTKPTIRKVMTYNEFLKLKPKNGYIYRAYEINFNLTLA